MYKHHMLEKLYDFVEENYDTLRTNSEIEYIIRRDLNFYRLSGWNEAEYYIKRIFI